MQLMVLKYLIIFFFVFCVNQTLIGQHLKYNKTKQGIEITEGENKVLFYHKESNSLDGQYSRAGYIHPLYSLDGEILTEDFPADHPHHHGIFWAWHQMVYNGENIADSWISKNISWDVKRVKTRKNSDHAILNAEVLWNSGKIPLISENTDIIVYQSTDQYRIIDFAIKLMPLVEDLKIGGSDDHKGYGGFSLRLKAPESITFLSQGKQVTPKETAVTAGPWLDFTGTFGNSQKSGIAVFNHPDNPGNINNWILRNSNSMQNAVYPGKDPEKLPADGTLLKYRLVIHNPDLDQEKISVLYQEYIR